MRLAIHVRKLTEYFCVRFMCEQRISFFLHHSRNVLFVEAARGLKGVLYGVVPFLISQAVSYNPEQKQLALYTRTAGKGILKMPEF